MKMTSVPEQAILFYIRKYVDSNAQNNNVRIERYVADITFTYRGQKYNIEYDSFSQHKDALEKDSIRNIIFANNGYEVIRMRDAGLEPIPNCINIPFIFPNYAKKALNQANVGLQELLSLFGIHEQIDIASDLALIREMYNRA